MARVAIIGSCITRDLWPIRGDLQGLLYVSRTSLPSLLAPPVKGFRPAAEPPPGLARHQHRAVVADLRKTALRALLAFRPTHLIFDFIDERFDLLALPGGGLVLDSWELEESGYRTAAGLRRARVVPRLSSACERLWLDGAAEFAALVRATTLKDARLILHSARWAERSRGAQGEAALTDAAILPGQPASIAAHNRLLTTYETEFARLMPPMHTVAAPEHRVADEAHRWGLSPFHYVPAYYAEIWGQLEALGVPRPATPSAGGPSVRAA